MHYVNAYILLTASLCATAMAQGRTFDGLQAPAKSPGTSLTTVDVSGSSLEHFDPRAENSLELQGQDPDYSMRGMFQQLHGEFMLKRERYDPMIETRGQYLPHMEILNEPGSMQLLNWGSDVELPFMVATDGYITVGGYFGERRYLSKGSSNFGDEKLYEAGIKAGFGVFLDENLLLEGLATPGYFTDNDSTLTRNDFKMYGKVLLTYRADENLFLKVGARSNGIFSDYEILPYLGVSWQPTDTFRIDVLLPEKAELSLWPDPSFGMMLGCEIQGNEYRVREATDHSVQADLHVQEVILYVGAIWRFSEFTSLLTRVGSTVAGDYKLDDGTNTTDTVKGPLEPGLFLELSFGIDF